MKIVPIMILILPASSIIGFCNLPTDPGEYRQWELESFDAIKAQEAAPPDVAIPKLGSWLVKLSSGANIEVGDRPVFHSVQSALLAIPEHAQYYQDKIEDIREQVKANSNLSSEEKERLRRAGKPAVGPSDYRDVRHAAFAVLAQLPSPETVAVLGHFLEDPEGRDGKDMLGYPLEWHDDVPPDFPNCGLACFAITKLGIEHAPIGDPKKVNTVSFDAGQVDVWKDWWQEVKAGKRTYRFKGSAIEYGADGPATKEQLDKREKDRRRTKEGRKGSGSASESPSGTGTASHVPVVAGILAGLAVLGSLVWYFRRAAR